MLINIIDPECYCHKNVSQIDLGYKECTGFSLQELEVFMLDLCIG